MATVKIDTNNLASVRLALENAGLAGDKLLLALSQVAHETGGFKNAKIKTHNNASGIVWINKPEKQKNASKGNPLPEAPKYHYAKFDTLNDWAKDYLRIVKTALNNSTNSGDYATALARIKYYEVSHRYPNAIKNYSAGLSAWGSEIKKAGTIISKNKNTIIPIVIIFTGLFFLFKRY